MNPRLAGVTVAIASLLLLSGCAGLGAPRSPDTPAPTGADVQVQISNEGSATHVFTVAVVPDGRFEGVRVEYRNGTTRTLSNVRNLTDLPHQVTKNAVSIVPLGESVTVRTYRLTPGSGVGTTFEDVPRNSTVVNVVSRPGAEEPLQSFGASTCGDAALTRIDLRVTPNGVVELSTVCEDATTAAA